MKNNPFIPTGDTLVGIIDKRASSKSKEILEARGIEVLETTRCEEVDDSIAYHPDIVIHPIKRKEIIVAPNVYDYYENKLSPLGIGVLEGNSLLSKKYPGDIGYNIGRIGNKVIHNLKHTDERLLKYFKKEGLELIDVNQGYSKCSLGIIGKYSGITADKMIYEKLTHLGCDILLIESGHIKLPGQNYGFIGGCMGNISEDEIVISGKLSGHPDEERIERFIEKHGKRVLYLEEDGLVDLGTIVFLERQKVR